MNDILAGKVRVFISSTAYDLNIIRKELEAFISSIGYEPVLNDSPNIAIPDKLDKIEACRWLVRTSDIFVLIIGGRYGSIDNDTGKSITWLEFDTAISAKIPTYIFVDREIFNKISTFEKLQDMVVAGTFEEKKVKEILGNKVEDLEVFKFIKHIDTENKGKWIHSFYNVSEIINCLKENWSQDYKNLLTTRTDTLKSVANKETIRPILKVNWAVDGKAIDFLQLEKPREYKPDYIESKYKKALINKDFFDILSSNIERINTILTNIDYEKLKLSRKFYDADELIQLLKTHNDRIDIILKIIKDGKFGDFSCLLDGEDRSKKLDFKIINEGTAPAEEVIIYIDLPKGLIINEVVPLSIDYYNTSAEIDSVLNLLNNIDILYQEAQNIDKKLTSTSSSLNNLFTFSQNYPNPFYKSGDLTLPVPSPPPRNIYLEDNRIRINLSEKKLKHKFNKLELSDLFILAADYNLNNEISVGYKCYADNLPYPDEGELKIHIFEK